MSETRNRSKAAEVPAGKGTEGRVKYRALTPVDMPRDFSISLDNLRQGGTEAFLTQAPAHAGKQKLPGFEPGYVNIVDYIVRITHRIWEEKDIGYIYDTYSNDCLVWDDFGLGSGRDRVVAHTAGTINAFPDIRIVADEVIWAGDPASAFHSSHRTQIFGTNTGYSQYGDPTGKRVQFWCMANCVMKDNEIFYEHVVYDFAQLIGQLGLDVVETARRMARETPASLPKDFLASEPSRSKGQAKPDRLPLTKDFGDDPEAFVRAALHNIWNRRDFSILEQVYHPAVLTQATAGRVLHGVGQLRSFMLSQLAMFPDLLFSVDDLYWMGNAEDGFLVATRWSFAGTHRGNGRYGAPTGREVDLWGITHWVIENGVVTKEWTMFNEFGVLMQLNR
ncbi:MAG: nuclear transport factor 2 family protein [Devosia sp.]